MGLFGTGVRRICGVVAASAGDEKAKKGPSALKRTRTIEVRLDLPRSDAERPRFLEWLAAGQPRNATFLATCRRREGGGKFLGAVDRELYWLIHAREAGCQWCDLEVETLRKLPGQSVREYPVPPRGLLSLHDVERTPLFPLRRTLPAYAGPDS